MPANTIETIRRETVKQTILFAENVIPLPWQTGLSKLEDYIISDKLLYVGPHGLVPQEANDLIDAIAGGSGFMLAIVVDKTRTKATVLPLLEVYEGHNRMELGLMNTDLDIDLNAIRDAVAHSLKFQTNVPKTLIQEDVIIIKQNIGRHRSINHITVASLNKKIDYPQKDQYMDWIQKTQDELNGDPSLW